MDRYTLRKLIKVHAWWHWVRVSEQVCKRQFICVHNSVALAFPFVVSHGSGGSTIFSKGACKYESSGQTSGQRNGRGGIGGGRGRVTVRVMSEYVDFFIWISEEFEVLFISRRLPRRLHGDHCKIRESLFGTCLQTLLT